MFSRKPRSDEAPRYQEPCPGVNVYPPGERVEVELTPAPTREYAPGRGPLDPDPTVTFYCGRYKREVTVRRLR